MLGLLTLDYKKLTGWMLQPGRFQMSDLQKIRDSGITVFHPAVGFTQPKPYAACLQDICGWNAFLDAHRKYFMRIDRVSDIDSAKASNKIGIIVGMQDSTHFQNVDDVDRFYALGQRISQLTYFNTRIGGGSTGPRVALSEYGSEIIARMNRAGMAIDVSHCGDRTTIEAIDASVKPVLATHCNCRALVGNSARCKTDEAIRKLAARGGVLGVTMYRPFVCAGGPATIDTFLDHVDHIAAIAGIEHVGLGTDVDLDGRDPGALKKHDLDGVSYPRKIFDLTEALLRRKYSEQNIRLILGGNFRRVLEEVWTPAA
jgi:membrane dipeptidase